MMTAQSQKKYSMSIDILKADLLTMSTLNIDTHAVFQEHPNIQEPFNIFGGLFNSEENAQYFRDSKDERDEYERVQIATYSNKFKQILEDNNDKKLLATLYESEKSSYEKLSIIMLMLASLSREVKTMISFTQHTLSKNEEAFLNNTNKIYDM